jgi:hypothetical protein
MGDDASVVHLLNLTSACVLFYAAVTRGGRAFARLLEKLAG